MCISDPSDPGISVKAILAFDNDTHYEMCLLQSSGVRLWKCHSVQYGNVQINFINYQNKGGKMECVSFVRTYGLSTVRAAHLITALLLSGIQFRLPTACNVERTQEPTPGKNSVCPLLCLCHNE